MRRENLASPPAKRPTVKAPPLEDQLAAVLRREADLNAALGQWLIGAGLAPDSYTALQGRALGRRGLIYVERILDDVWVGGRTVTVIDGTVSL